MITGPEAARALARPSAIFLEGRLPVLEARLVQTLGLHDGQVVRPTVEVRGTEVKLVLQGRLVDLPPGLRLLTGDTPQLRVQMLPSGQAALHPVTGPAAEAAPHAAANLPPGAMLRLEHLAYRPPTMEALLHLLRPGVLQGLLNSAPQPEASEWIQRLLKLRPSVAQLTPSALREAVLRSGWLTEALLGQGRGAKAADGDAKALLRQLLRSWTDAPQAIRNQISEAINDIEAGQLRAVQSGLSSESSGRELVFALALPFADADPVSIQLYRERRGREEGKPALTVHLHSRSSELGEVWLQTRIAETQVDMVMWAVREDVAQRAERDVGGLALALEGAGLLLTGLQVIHGPRTQEAMDEVPLAPGRLVDLQA